MAAHYVHDLSPFLIRFSENFGIRYYGLAYVLGFICALLLLRWYHERGRSPLDGAARADLMVYLIVGVAVGGRLGFFLFYDPGAVVRDPLLLIRIWEGGMASHGGFIGVFLALWWFCRRRGYGLLPMGDILVTLAPAGLFFGRVANFINGELWGKVTTVPWGVIFPSSAPGLPVEAIPARHPSQLYEAGLEGLFLFIYCQVRFWRSGVVRHAPGQLAGEFLLGYAVARIIGEVFREPDAGVGLTLGMNRGAFLSLFLAGAGIAVIALARWRAARSPGGAPGGRSNR
ncbi:MAG: prolipoprotein diacylglyceryl transferase [Puniceicoccaceae bacterium]|nr:MAG: prolipoprotein diacylglyceryl transferase [Puniceicoccaceae bacterium]